MFAQIPVTLEEMLECRQSRAALSEKLCITYAACVVVCLTMNMAGEYKISALSRSLFFVYIAKVRDVYSNDIKFEKIQLHQTGDTYWCVVKDSPEHVKELALTIEENGAGRVFDIDVMVYDGVRVNKLSRDVQRKCIVCDNNAFECARSRKHGIADVVASTENIMRHYIADTLGGLACRALIDEVNATPKPGLVDSLNSGAHCDMDINTFYSSANALNQYFINMAYISTQNINCELSELMNKLVLMGKQAENAMYKVSGGANTHMGAIYTLGLLLSGVAYAVVGAEPYEYAYNVASELARCGCGNVSINELSGARREACMGFELVKYAKERLETYLNELKGNQNTACVFTLIDLMASTNDTNILRRGGETAKRYVWERAQSISLLPYDLWQKAIEQLDIDMTNRNLSCGGCADLLAAALFMHAAENHFYDRE